MHIVTSLSDLEPHHSGALVPTMGGLHEGHLSLIRRGRTLSDSVAVSVFVNPTQFDSPDDLARYPRQLEVDAAAAKQAGATVVFAPGADVVYPPDEEPSEILLPDVARLPGLEDRCRPGHLRGVCHVVARLFDLARPRWAIFGEKDFQQLRAIEALVQQEAGRWPGLEVVAEPTVRDADGLAMSSRNEFLSDGERAAALSINRALLEAVDLATPGRDISRIEEQMRATLVRHQLEVEYAVVRDAATLLSVETVADGAALRALIAARAGTVRLIDNRPI